MYHASLSKLCIIIEKCMYVLYYFNYSQFSKYINGLFLTNRVVPGLNKVERKHERLLTFASVNSAVSCVIVNAMGSFLSRSGKHLPGLRSGEWLYILCTCDSSFQFSYDHLKHC